MRLSWADAFYLRLWEKSHRAVAAFSGSAESAGASDSRIVGAVTGNALVCFE
jgi:hypothetical protein